MTLHIHPKQLSGEVTVPTSKSEAHRLLVCGALSGLTSPGEKTEVCFNSCDDTEATVRCLSALGFNTEKTEAGVFFRPPHKISENAFLDCGESGATLRFLLPAAAALGVSARFTGRGRLLSRPMEPLAMALADNGCVVSPSGALLLETAGRLRSGVFILPGDVSSQFVSGLLMALPLLEGDSEIRLTSPLESAPYTDMTMDIMARFNVLAEVRNDVFYIRGGQKYASLRSVQAGGDWSSAAFWLCSGALGGPVTLNGLDPEFKRGDGAICDILSLIGAKIGYGGETVTARRGGLRAAEINAADIPDLVPPVAVVAALSPGETSIRGVERLRYKESNRVDSVIGLLHALGGEARENGGVLRIRGKAQLEGGTVDACGDHRIVMAAAITAPFCKEGVTLCGAEAVSKSYPGFFEDFRRLGGVFNVL